MSSCNYNCDNQLGAYVENNCQLELDGGSDQALFLECGHGIIDPSSYSQVNAAIVAGKARLVSGASFGIPAASANKQASKVPCRADTLLSYNRTITYYNPNISQTNSTFHKQLFAGHKVAGLIIYECGADQITFINEDILFTGSRVLTETQDEKQYYGGTGEFKSINDPLIHNKPAGIFS